MVLEPLATPCGIFHFYSKEIGRYTHDEPANVASMLDGRRKVHGMR